MSYNVYENPFRVVTLDKRVYNPSYDILTEKYPFILKEMLNDDFYIVQDRTYDYFSTIETEIDNRVVGFFVGDYYTDDCFVVDIIFILKSYRGKGLLNKTVNDLFEVLEVGRIVFNNPNKFLINALTYHGYCDNKKVRDWVYFKGDVLLSYTLGNGEHYVFSRVYDLCLCGVIDSNNYVLSPVLNWDDDCFNAVDNRKQVKSIEEYIKSKNRELKQKNKVNG